MLGLIENQDGAVPLFVAAQKMVGQGQTHFLLAASLVGQRQIEQDGLQQARSIANVAVGQKGSAGARAEAFEQAVTEKRLAGAGSAGKGQHSLAVCQTGQQSSNGPLVTGGGIIASGIRRGREGPLPKSKMRRIHRAKIPRPAKDEGGRIMDEYGSPRIHPLSDIRDPSRPGTLGTALLSKSSSAGRENLNETSLA